MQDLLAQVMRLALVECPALRAWLESTCVIQLFHAACTSRQPWRPGRRALSRGITCHQVWILARACQSMHHAWRRVQHLLQALAANDALTSLSLEGNRVCALEACIHLGGMLVAKACCFCSLLSCSGCQVEASLSALYVGIGLFSRPLLSGPTSRLDR